MIEALNNEVTVALTFRVYSRRIGSTQPATLLDSITRHRLVSPSSLVGRTRQELRQALDQAELDLYADEEITDVEILVRRAGLNWPQHILGRWSRDVRPTLSLGRGFSKLIADTLEV